MARLLSAESIIELLTSTVGDLKPGDLSDLAAALDRIPGGSSISDLDEHRAQEKTVGTLLAGGFGAGALGRKRHHE
jgi:hypothetical protein